MFFLGPFKLYVCNTFLMYVMLCSYKQSYIVLSQVLCVPFNYLDYFCVPFPHVYFLQPLH